MSADEFLRASLEPSALMDRFKRAAIEDATDCADVAMRTPLQPLALPDWRTDPRSWTAVPAVAVMSYPSCCRRSTGRMMARLSRSETETKTVPDSGIPP